VKPTVAVVTATTNRATLKQAMESVDEQTYPCTHYVIIDGVRGNDTMSYDDPPNRHILRLPKATGKNGIMNGAICAMAPYICTEDYICYLDDDNWFEPNHVESLMDVIGNNAYAYSLRNLIWPTNKFYARDDGESLGHYGDLVDVNCYMFKREVCAGIAPLWYKTTGDLMIGDRYVWEALRQNNTPWAASGKYTVNYRISANKDMRGFFFLKNIQKRAQYPDGFPWRAETCPST